MKHLRGLALVLMAWFALFGVWPFANPDHGDDTFIAYLDLSLHIVFGTACWAWIIYDLSRRRNAEPEQEQERWVTLLIQMVDAMGTLRVHPIKRTWRNLWRQQYVACLAVSSFDGAHHIERHSDPGTYADALYYARCEYLRMAWHEQQDPA